MGSNPTRAQPIFICIIFLLLLRTIRGAIVLMRKGAGHWGTEDCGFKYSTFFLLSSFLFRLICGALQTKPHLYPHFFIDSTKLILYTFGYKKYLFQMPPLSAEPGFSRNQIRRFYGLEYAAEFHRICGRNL